MEERFTFVKYNGVVYPNYVVSTKGYIISYIPHNGTKTRVLRPIYRNGYMSINLCQDRVNKLCLIHRIVYESFHLFENLKDKVVDHLDLCKTNNNLSNLRSCNKSENGCNTIVRKDNKLGIKGIRMTKSGTCRCYIMKNGVNYLKSFKTIEEGQQWLTEMRHKLHGEYARDS